MPSALIVAALLAVLPLHAAPAPGKDGDAAYATVLKLRAEGKGYEATKILWPAADKYTGHVAIQAAYADEAIPEGYYDATLGRCRFFYGEAPTPENAYLLARIDYDRVRAHDVVDRALRTGSRLPGLLAMKALHRVEDLGAAGKYEAALAVLDGSTEAAKAEPAMTRKMRIALLAGMGKIHEADALANAVWEKDRSDPGIRSLLLDLAYARGDLTRIEVLSYLTPGATDFAFAAMARAAYLDAVGKATQARAIRKRVLEMPRDFYGWDAARMQAMMSLGDWEGAGQQAVALRALDPGDSSAQATLAGYALWSRNVSVGEKMARDAVAKNPRSLWALEQMASIEFGHGRYRDAILLYDRAIDLAPGIARLWIARGAAFSHLGNRAAQRRSMDRASKINPNDPYLLSELGRMHLEAGEYAEGLTAYTRLVSHEEPGFSEYRGFGRCSVGANRLEQGLAAFERARELAATPERKKLVKEDVEWAKGFLREATELYPRDAAARVEKVGIKTYLDDAPIAVFQEGGRLVVGTPWGARSARWAGEGANARRILWAPSGNGVYALMDNRIDFLELKTGEARTVVAEVPTQTAFSDELPRARYISSFALAPNGKHLYALSWETKRGKTRASVILDYTAEEKKPREVFRRDGIGFMQPDPVTGRLLIAGGGNLRLDLAAGTTEEFPLVGCTTGDMDYSPGGERMACVAVDAKGPETNEIILYDLATRKKVPLEIAGQGASWSPDGQRIAYVWRGRQLRVLELKTAQVTAYDVGHERDHLLPYPVDGGTGTRWSADGRFIHCRLGAAKGKAPRDGLLSRGEPTSLIVDLRGKVAWTRPGPLHDFEWAPAPKP